MLSSVLKEPWPIYTEVGETKSALTPEVGSPYASTTGASVAIGFLGLLGLAFLGLSIKLSLTRLSKDLYW